MQSSFHRFGLHSNLISRLSAVGITTPTSVQLTAINALKRRLPQDGDDSKWSFGREALVIDSATGSGKTLAYLLPIADLSMISNGAAAAAIAVPSATLASQVRDQAAHLLGPDQVQFIDCTSQVQNSKSSVFIGKLDHLARMPTPILDRLRCVVLDEADMILNPPGKYEYHQRMQSRAPKRQAALGALHNLLGNEARAPTKNEMVDDEDDEDAIKSHDEFDAALRAGSAVPPLLVAVSATANNRLSHMLKISKLAHRVKMLSPTNSPFDLPPRLLHQYLIITDAGEDRQEINCAPAIMKLFRSCPRPSLVVAPDNFSLDMVRAALEYEGAEAVVIDEIESDEQSGFKKDFDGSKILLGSERSIRGLDIPSIEHVIIIEIPKATKDYVHIAGRTARMGRSGTVTTLLTAQSVGRIQGLAKELNVSIQQAKVN